MTKAQYISLIGNLYHVYTSLEAAQDAHSHLLGGMYNPSVLNRRSSLLHDYAHHTGVGVPPPPTPAAAEYCARLADLSETDPKAIIAHAYTRYMGDLSGGQVLSRCASKLFGSDEGLTFYDFGCDDAAVFKEEYRRALNDLSLTEAEKSEVVAEANVAFVLNMRIFEELDVMGGVEGASVRPLADALKWRGMGGGDGRDKDKEEECPFGFKGPNPHGAKKSKASADDDDDAPKCPWPFILLHDPAEGAKDWRTWAVAAAVAAWGAGRVAAAVAAAAQGGGGVAAK